MKSNTFFKLVTYLCLVFGVSLCIGCNEEKKEIEDFEFWKVNIVTPNPKKTLDSLTEKYDLVSNGEVDENNGFISGSLELANASIQVKTYLDNSEHSSGPTEITILTNIPDSVAYQKLKENGLEVNKPFRREGWNFSVITIPDLKIFGDKSNGVYICKFDGDRDEMIENQKWRDSVRSSTSVELKSIKVYAPDAKELEKSWKKINSLISDSPKLLFASDSIYRMELVIN